MNVISKIINLLDYNLKKYLFFILIIVLLTALLETLSIATFYPLLDLLVNSSETEINLIKLIYEKIIGFLAIDNVSVLSLTAILVFTIYVLKILILLFCNWHNSSFEFRIRNYLTRKLYAIYLKKDYQSLIKYNSSDIIKNIDHELNIFSSGVAATMTIITEGLIFFGIISFLFYFNYKITFSLLLFFGLILFLLQLSYNKILVNWGKTSQKFNKLRLQNFIETFNAIKEIKVFRKERIFYKLMKKFNTRFFEVNKNEIFLRNVPRALLELVLIICVTGYLLFFSFNEITFNNVFASIGVYLVAAYRTFPSANRIITSMQRLKFAHPMITNIYDQINNENSDSDNTFEKEDIDKNDFTFEKSIEINNCSFYFQNKDITILDNLNVKFQKGKIYGIKGSSGVGKTTLLNVIVGLFEPSEGSITVDSIALDRSKIQGFRKFISYVPQNTFLFDNTIEKNITFDFDEESNSNFKKIDNLIKNLSLDRKISQLKKGLQTPVGEKGVNLSGGQIQRIGIARALYHEPKLLILDESTNALEKDTEEKIMKYIHGMKEKMITIIIAHRESAFKYCDKIFELESGKLNDIKTN